MQTGYSRLIQPGEYIDTDEEMSPSRPILRYNVRTRKNGLAVAATGRVRRCAKARLSVQFRQMNDAISSRDFGDDRRLGVVYRIARYHEQIGPLMRRAVEDARQESHWARGMGERGEAGMMECGDEDAHGDADGFGDIIVFDPAAVRPYREGLGKDGDEVGRCL